MAARRLIRVCGWWSHTFHLGVKEWIVRWEKLLQNPVVRLRTIAWWWSDGNRTPLLLRVGNPVESVQTMWQDALYYLVMGICITTPFSEIAAPMVALPPSDCHVKSHLIRITHMYTQFFDFQCQRLFCAVLPTSGWMIKQWDPRDISN